MYMCSMINKVQNTISYKIILQWVKYVCTHNKVILLYGTHTPKREKDVTYNT